MRYLKTLLASIAIVAAFSGSAWAWEKCDDPTFLATRAWATARSSRTFARIQATHSCSLIAQYRAEIIDGDKRINAAADASTTCNNGAHISGDGVQQAAQLWQQYCTGSARVPRITTAQASPRPQPTQPVATATGGSSGGSCSDITGTGSSGGGGGSCASTGQSLGNLASQQQRSNPSAAIQNYKAAAEAYRRAKMWDAQNRMLQALADVMASLPSDKKNETDNISRPSSGRSTAYCSSTEVGQAKQCISITKSGDGGRRGYYVNATCDGTYYAAISTYDENDKCERGVVSVSTGNPTLVYSYFHRPGVLDAIAGGKLSLLNCYTARHKGGAC